MIREGIIDTNDDVGTFHIVKQQDCEDMLKALQEIPEHYRYHKAAATRKWFCSIPNILAVQWAREWGVQLYSKEWTEKAYNTVKHDPNFSKLRVKLQ